MSIPIHPNYRLRVTQRQRVVAYDHLDIRGGTRHEPADVSYLEITSAGSTAITPSPNPPARISTQGGYASPRGGQASLLSSGEATAAKIDATFEASIADKPSVVP